MTEPDIKITSLYDFILVKAIGGVLNTFLYGTESQAWDSLKTLYDVLDPKVKNEVKGLIDEVDLQVNKIMVKRGYAASDVLKKQGVLRNYINEKKHELLDKIMVLLHQHNYLKLTWHPLTREEFKKQFGEEQ